MERKRELFHAIYQEFTKFIQQQRSLPNLRRKIKDSLIATACVSRYSIPISDLSLGVCLLNRAYLLRSRCVNTAVHGKAIGSTVLTAHITLGHHTICRTRICIDTGTIIAWLVSVTCVVQVVVVTGLC